MQSKFHLSYSEISTHEMEPNNLLRSGIPTAVIIHQQKAVIIHQHKHYLLATNHINQLEYLFYAMRSNYYGHSICSSAVVSFLFTVC